MYVWIWRHLPGPLVVRLLQCLVLLTGALAVLFFWVFPWVEAKLPYNDVTVPGPTSSVAPTPAPGASAAPTTSPSAAPTELPAG